MPKQDTNGLVSTFRPRARLLQLLGDQLIGSPRLAIFELVKNAYDADASEVTVTMTKLTSPDASIEVLDDGTGMSLDTIKNVWLVPGHDHKALQRESGQRTPRGRLPLGEKGVGRFAVHKLGNVVELVTRHPDQADEIVLRIDWADIASQEFLSEAKVSAHSRKPEVFVGGRHGTRVRVTSLRGTDWSRGEVRRLARQIHSISSPFAERANDFKATLVCPNQRGWLSGLPNTMDLVDAAPWEFSFELKPHDFTWSYAFRQIPSISLPGREASGSETGVLLDPSDLPEPTDRAPGKRSRKPVVSSPQMQDGIGTIRGRVYVYDRDPDVLARMGFSQSLQQFLDETGGMRVYRDGMRVYNYGELGDDWLGLDLRRVNAPSRRVSNNIIVGAIELSLKDSTALVEKTNREGFVENEALGRLRALVLGILAVFENERNKDKTAIRKLLAKDRSISAASIERPLQSIRRIAKKSGILEEVEPLLKSAQKSFDEMRSIMLRAGVSNMSLVLVYHEVEHGMRLLERNLRRSGGDASALEQAKNLVAVIDGFGDVLRKNKPSEHDLRSVVTRALDLNAVRLRNHRVAVESRIDWSGNADIPLSILPLGLVLGALTNLIDNSIYWMSARWPDHRDENGRRLYVGVNSDEFQGRPTIVVADNGPGFVDELADATEPFFTRRPDGLGIGLYYVSLIMHTIGGELRLLEKGDADVPSAYDGAALALIFPGS